MRDREGKRGKIAYDRRRVSANSCSALSLPLPFPTKARACRQIVDSNDKSHPLAGQVRQNQRLPLAPPRLRGIKLQFVICNSECRLIYSCLRPMLWSASHFQGS
jgi:hypothetical protein